MLESLVAEVRELKRGLWADPHPVPPWEWRKRRVGWNMPAMGPGNRGGAYGTDNNHRRRELCDCCWLLSFLSSLVRPPLKLLVQLEVTPGWTIGETTSAKRMMLAKQSIEGSTTKCPIGSYPWIDEWGNKICKTYQGDQQYYDTSKSCPIGTYPWVDQWGNRACEKF